MAAMAKTLECLESLPTSVVAMAFSIAGAKKMEKCRKGLAFFWTHGVLWIGAQRLASGMFREKYGPHREDRGEVHCVPAREEDILGRTKTRLDLWEEHLKDPIIALEKTL